MAAIMMSAMRDNAMRDFAKKHDGWDGSNRSNRNKSYDRNHAIPKWARRYSKRYGGKIHHA